MLLFPLKYLAQRAPILDLLQETWVTKLGCGGHLVELVRLSQGKFELKDAKKVDEVQMSDLINMEDLSF